MIRHDDAARAVLAREPRVLRRQDALDEQRQPRLRADALEVAPRERRRDGFEHLLRGHPAATESGDANVLGNRERSACVALAVAAHRRVDRQHERAEPAVACLRDQLARHALVAEHVELEPERRAGRRDLGRRRGRDRRQAHDRARSLGGAGHPHLAVGMRDALERDRRHEQRHRDVLPEHRSRRRARLDVDQQARPQTAATERLDVVAQRHLVTRAAGVVAVGAGLETLCREPLVVPDVERHGLRHATERIRPLPPRRAGEMLDPARRRR